MTRHSTSGAVVGLTIVALLLFPNGPSGLMVLVMAVSLILIERACRGVTGTRVSEFRRGRAWIYAVVGNLLGAGIVVGGWFLVVDRHNKWVAWVVGAAIFVVIVMGGWLFERPSRTAVNSGRR